VSRLIVFLDVGGVINEKCQQTGEFGRLVGDFFASLSGGTSQAWAIAHSVVTDRLLSQESVSVQTASDYMSFYWTYQLNWVRGMYGLLNIPVPPEEECIDLAYRAIAWIAQRTQAVLPSAVETIRALHEQDYRLHTASGACSIEIAGYLEGMQVRHCFGRLYGADLINTFKGGPEYYARIFADVGILPAEALVVDDSLSAIAWAAQAGAKTVLVNASSHPEKGAMPRIGSLAELPAFLQQQG
jgi:HAD superfamily hydrolase (TIGR01509 family)